MSSHASEVLKDKKIVFVGAGNMGEALISGLLKSGVNCTSLTAIDPNQDRLNSIKEKYPISGYLHLNKELISDTHIYILAVKPQIISSVLSMLKKTVQNNPLVISIAAGINLKTLKSEDGIIRIIRVMPNTPALVGAGISAICIDTAHVIPGDLEIAEALFKSVGEVVLVDEKQIDAVTGLSGSGPAYVMMFLEALTAGGVLEGLSRDVAYKLALHTVTGSARLAEKLGKHPAILKDQVTSPGGTTISGIKALEKGGFRQAVMEAVSRAAKRSRELSQDDSSK